MGGRSAVERRDVRNVAGVSAASRQPSALATTDDVAVWTCPKLTSELALSIGEAQGEAQCLTGATARRRS
jgi:hypothetical protein